MISVIVPARDALDCLGECLDGLLHQRGLVLGIDYEVLVVDDGSTDGTAALARARGARCISQANAGPAAARNHGARLAQGELLAFTDADCVPDETWLAALVRPFADPEVVGVKGVYATRERNRVARFVQCEYASKYQRMAGLARIDFIDTYSAAYRREVFLQNGGFDEVFPVPSVEDQEFSFRLARKGYQLVFQPGAVVWHHHDLSVAEYAQRKFGIGFWKAVMLNWLPEKVFSDSHTPPSQRWQIVLLGIAGLCGLAGLAWRPLLWLAFILLAAFLASSLPLLAFVARSDPGVAWLTPGMVVVRAAALGAGIFEGLLHAPAGLPRKGYSLTQRAAKRLLDLLGGGLGLLFSAPLIGLAALAVRLDSPGPAFFIQLRAGEHGRPFRIYKLRSMVVGAEWANGERYPGDKHADDPRVTRVGRFLRRWSLDELPQFFNVLHGEMSLVGPRPEELRLVAQYSDAERECLLVKPGLTGPMQVAGRGTLDREGRLAVEMAYIRDYSLARDLAILGRSVPVVLSGKGAF
jgi:lipopolysaccharide/colanic/teichoic acid biosynthesis glycosyltransferase